MTLTDILYAMGNRVSELSIVQRRLSDAEQSEVDILTRGLEAMADGVRPPEPSPSYDLQLEDLRPPQSDDAVLETFLVRAAQPPQPIESTISDPTDDDSGWSDEAAG